MKQIKIKYLKIIFNKIKKLLLKTAELFTALQMFGHKICSLMVPFWNLEICQPSFFCAHFYDFRSTKQSFSVVLNFEFLNFWIFKIIFLLFCCFLLQENVFGGVSARKMIKFKIYIFIDWCRAIYLQFSALKQNDEGRNSDVDFDGFLNFRGHSTVTECDLNLCIISQSGYTLRNHQIQT